MLGLLATSGNLPSWLNHIDVLGLSFSLAHFLDLYGYVVVFLFIAVENLGVPFPGETMLLAASVYAAQGAGLQEPLVILGVHPWLHRGLQYWLLGGAHGRTWTPQKAPCR